MADAHLGVFDAAVVRVVDDQGVVGDVRHAAAFGADEGDGGQAVVLGPLERLFIEIDGLAGTVRLLPPEREGRRG